VRVARKPEISRIRHEYPRRLIAGLAGRDPNRVFAATPAALRRLVRGLTARELTRRPVRGKWPIAWIVHHLCDTELGMAFRIRMAMAESGSRFQSFDQDKWARGLHYADRKIGTSIETFTALRRSHLELIGHSGRTDLARFGIHEERGRESVERMIHLLAGHDLNHLRQIRTLRGLLRPRGTTGPGKPR